MVCSGALGATGAIPCMRSQGTLSRLRSLQPNLCCHQLSSASFALTNGALFTSVADQRKAVGQQRLRVRAAGAEPELDLVKAKSNIMDPGVLDLWRNAEAVCFDVDSTVCEDEGIDELAAFCGAGEAVAAWTARAMGGSVPFEVALAARLDLFKPSASDVAKLLASKPPRLSTGIKDLVNKLHSKGTHVYLVSGGFRQMIEPAAELLNISKDRIYANNLLFGENGEFTGFDATEPTSRSGGKAKVIEKIKAEFGYTKLIMIGDGATDLEARRPGGADMFICYGGVAVRPKVVEGSDVFVTTFTDLINTL
ncbi:phosphoserine phosphatase [Marchantia polymorpha subsp. ruderalis]|uniref:phosphoserine phosphatase n=1 Tax=Marchantia polymorpha TaxID=3197 RepID=A0A2R6XCD7_MARPO|nr:hypothetical protein MARPO_0023s0019 [Marchantia polymorpha]BBN01816.1 hypothetical protein Mp_2g10500 [Marchantia polymorpha subsp. ruderalis]|eukprot:PTQ43679.1 hypothetical protein MARPO_0023s0019 [Marchantia polymorpha]